MLKKISCDKFKLNDEPRGPIEFHMGLNTVLGDDKASNSIGKSTLLMIIDFCFGGDDYVDKEKDTIKKVGEHTICFEFVFGGESKYFRRTTDNKGIVEVCDANYSPIKTITNDAFKAGLLKYYQLENGEKLSLRDWVSPFFRIYNRRTHNELRPINAHVRESDNSGIINLLKMYGTYSPLEHLDEDYQQAKDMKREFDNLKRFKVAPIAESDTEKAELEKELQQLKDELAHLDADNLTGSSNPDDIEIATKVQLRKEKAKLSRKLSELKGKLNDIEINAEYSEDEFARQYNGLLEFFPDVKVNDIKELEKFHKDVAGFLKEDVEQSNLEINDMISLINAQIAEINAKLKEYKAVPNVSEAYVKRREELKEAIRLHEEAISNFDKRKTAVETFKVKEKSLNESTDQYTTAISTRINNLMKSYNLQLRTKDEKIKAAPILSFNKLTSYAFYTPDDNGTGSRYKALCLLDLAIISSTKLPAMAHDSVIFTNIEDETALDLLKLYATKTDKQIFVGVEKPIRYQETLEDGSTRNIARECKVIELSEDKGALFGDQWNKHERQ